MPFQPDYPVPPERTPYTFTAEPQPNSVRVGCLMLHGFMGSPTSSRPMAQHLAQNGVTVYCPLLPGHGEFPRRMYKISRQAWIAEAEEALAHIRPMCDQLFLMGHSMGNVLGAHLVSSVGGFQGMIMLVPVYALPDKRLKLMRWLRYVMPWFYPYKLKKMRSLVKERVHDFDPTIDFDDPEVQAWLPQATRIPTGALAEMAAMIYWGRTLWPKLELPVLMFEGGKDRAVPAGTIPQIYELLPGKEKHLESLPHAGHEMMRPFDPAHTEVWARILDFMERHSDLRLPAPD
jgi:carboxylesterase